MSLTWPNTSKCLFLFPSQCHPPHSSQHIPPVQNTLCHMCVKQTIHGEIALLKATFCTGDPHPTLGASCSFGGEGWVIDNFRSYTFSSFWKLRRVMFNFNSKLSPWFIRGMNMQTCRFEDSLPNPISDVKPAACKPEATGWKRGILLRMSFPGWFLTFPSQWEGTNCCFLRELSQEFSGEVYVRL